MLGVHITYKETGGSAISRIEESLTTNGFSVISDGFYVCEQNGLVKAFSFMEWLKSHRELTEAVDKIHAFRLNDLSDFSDFIRE